MRLVLAMVFGVAAAALLRQGQAAAALVFDVVTAVFVAGAVQAGRGAGGGGTARR